MATDTQLTLKSRVRGCLLGGALGDALGAPVESLPLSEIRERFGPDGIPDFTHGRLGAVTDVTQMTLFTAEGLMRAYVRESLKGICSVPGVVSHAYLRWLLTQGVSASSHLEIGTDGWLWTVNALHSPRAPDGTCVSALQALPHLSDERARNDSKSAGAIMRVAPVALVVDRGDDQDAAFVFERAKPIAWITHGHPTSYLSAAAFAVIIHALLWGHSLAVGIARARRFLTAEEHNTETLDAIDRALLCLKRGERPNIALARIGQGWVSEEALGVAIYCAGTTNDFVAGVRSAVNHDGDSATTGALAGQLLGAINGEDGLPVDWLRSLELRDTITEIADDLSEFLGWDLDLYEDSGGFTDRVWNRYPGW